MHEIQRRGGGGNFESNVRRKLFGACAKFLCLSGEIGWKFRVDNVEDDGKRVEVDGRSLDNGPKNETS